MASVVGLLEIVAALAAAWNIPGAISKAGRLTNLLALAGVVFLGAQGFHNYMKERFDTNDRDREQEQKAAAEFKELIKASTEQHDAAEALIASLESRVKKAQPSTAQSKQRKKRRRG